MTEAFIRLPRLLSPLVRGTFGAGLTMILTRIAFAADGITEAAPAADAPAAVSSAVPAAVPAIASILPADLSPMGMFMSADPVVKAVMIGLAIASIVTWTVFAAKTIELAAARRRARASLATLAAAQSLAEAVQRLGSQNGPVAQMATEAAEEVTRSGGYAGDGLVERVQLAMERVEAGARRAAGRGIGVLATIGATAPFVGLFGTVWGIMNSFLGIAKSQTTNLAIVAPGIAEALLATAAGLVAAIPAVVIYNVFARRLASDRAQLTDAASLLLRHVSRDHDRRQSPISRAAE